MESGRDMALAEDNRLLRTAIFASNGTLTAVCSIHYDEAAVYDARGGNLRTLQHARGIEALAFSPMVQL